MNIRIFPVVNVCFVLVMRRYAGGVKGRGVDGTGGECKYFLSS